MSLKDRDTKYCFVCETHFKLSPDEHEDIHHDDGRWVYINGTAREHYSND